MIDSINTGWYILLSVLVYLYLGIFSIVNIFTIAYNYYSDFKNKLNEIINKNLSVKGYAIKIRNLIAKILSYLALKGIKHLQICSIYVNKFDSMLTNNDRVIIGEPINYISLTLRKIFDLSFQTWIIYTAAIIVVFYFILTVF